MNIFGRRRAQDTTSGRDVLSDLPFVNLESSIITGALSCASATQVILAEHVGAPLSNMQRLESDSEHVYLFLHLTNRFAFGAGGSAARDRIQDRIATSAISAWMRAAWSTSDRPHDEFERWLARATEEQIVNLNQAEVEYGTCSSIAAESGLSGDDNVLGKFSRSVGAVIDAGVDPLLWALLEGVALRGIGASELRHHVEHCVNLTS